jgi:hypothetical protein
VTAPDGPLARARRWSAALAAALDEVTEQLDTAARRLTEGWPDARGQDWVDHLHLLRRTAARDAGDAHDLGRVVDRVADDLDGGPGGGAPVPGTGGPQLGSTAARRADDRRGVTIPRLGDTAEGGS